MNWQDGPYFCLLVQGDRPIAEITKQRDGSWTAFDLTKAGVDTATGTNPLGNYGTQLAAKQAVEASIAP